MRAFKLLPILGLALTALLAAAPASAQSSASAVPSRTGHTACVWARLPEGLRQQLILYADKPGDLREQVRPYLDDYNAASAACGIAGRLQFQPLRAFAEMRGIEATFFEGANPDVVERAFLALPEDARNQMTIEWLRRPYEFKVDSDLIKATHLSMHGVAGPRVDDLWVNAYLEQVAKLLFWERHMFLEGRGVGGVMSCVYQVITPRLSGAAYSAAEEASSLASFFEADPRAVEYASNVCLFNPVSPFVLGEQVKLAFLYRQVELPSGKRWSDVDLALKGLPESDLTHLKTILSAQDATASPGDVAFLDSQVFQVMRSVGLRNFPDSPFPNFIKMYMTAKAHVDLYEDVDWP